MKSFKIRQTIVLLLIAGVSHLFAQKITVSEPLYYNIENLEGYSVSPKINSSYLFFSWQNEKLKVEALNENLKKMWSKDEIIERNAKVIVLELIPNLESFCVVVSIQKDSIDYIKVLKFDNQVKLLDSATLSVWQSKHFNHRIERFISEDKKVLLSVTSSDISAHNILCAFSLDSMKSIWKYNIREKPVSKEELFRHWVLTNDGTVFFITDEKSGAGDKNKQIDVIQYDKNNSIIDFKITGSKLNSKQANFSFDNVKKQIIGFGTYSNQNLKVSNGIYYLSIPQFAPLNYKFSLVPFDNNFVTAFFGKKVKRNVGIKNLNVRNINHQTNGSTIVFFEQSHFERYQYWRGSWLHSTEIDFFYNNMFSMSLH